MATPILLCCDLDRTLIPNGPQPESPAARPVLRALAHHPALRLAYVSGRHQALLQEAIAAYDLPMPRYAIGDVGTTIYLVRNGQWEHWPAWEHHIGRDWNDLSRVDLQILFADLPDLRLQEPEKQNTYKLSYYAPARLAHDAVLCEMERRLAERGVRANLIWSVDETTGQGLLDVLPRSANKLHAIRFLMSHRGFEASRTVFAGDSGNDLAVLVSPLPGVLVANAQDEVRRAAVQTSERDQTRESLYLARGDFLGMNGNYAAGVLEGLAHFLPETRPWMEQALGQPSRSGP